MPECTVHLTQAVIYMAMAPKSNAMYRAWLSAQADAKEMEAEPVPLQIRNAPTSLMHDLGYGEGYQYAHDASEKLTTLQCLPDKLAGKRYYLPDGMGQESAVKDRLEQILQWKKEHRG